MNHVICAIKDRAIDSFLQPFFTPAVGSALRAFGDEVNKSGSPMNAHPDDYDLYELGLFTDQSGEITMIEAPRLIGRGKDIFQGVNNGSKS